MIRMLYDFKGTKGKVIKAKISQSGSLCFVGGRVNISLHGNKRVLHTLGLEIAPACVKEVGTDKHDVALPFWMGVTMQQMCLANATFTTSVCEDGADEHNSIFQYEPLQSAINAHH